MIQPPKLQIGDTIALISPAKAIEEQLVLSAKSYFENAGFNVLVGAHATGTDRYFSGSDAERSADFQWAIDHPEVKAIVCNRGGYGSVRLFDLVNWANLLREPKWIFGFSDITYFHLLGHKLGIETAHSTMPLNFADNSPESLNSLMNILHGAENHYTWESTPQNKLGEATGKVIAGNLSILYALLGTAYHPSFEQAILVIEDIGEQYYHLDRMFWALHFAGVFEQINGLIIGGMTDMKDTATPTEWTVEELVLQHTKYRNIPVAFQGPIGHLSDNRAFINGRIATFQVTETHVSFHQ